MKRIQNRLAALILIGLSLLWPHTLLSAPEKTVLRSEVSTYIFSDWAGPDIPVWTYLPRSVDLRTAPILIVMHGNGRNSESYLQPWAPLAEEKGVILVAPNFGRDNFPTSRHYNLGHVFDEMGNRRDEAHWTFSAIEPVFDDIVERLGSNQTSYTIYGHSAGSQFVHRFLYFKPQARIKRVLAANAGWYTMPDQQIGYPYGLSGSGVSDGALKHALETEVVVLLGDQDIDAAHPSLRRAPEAMDQGSHRFARGQSFYRRAQEVSSDLKASFNWQKVIVPDVSHSNAGMAAAAIHFVE